MSGLPTPSALDDRRWRELLATAEGAGRWQRAAQAANAELNAFTEIAATRDLPGARGVGNDGRDRSDNRGSGDGGHGDSGDTGHGGSAGSAGNRAVHPLAGMPFAVKDNIAVRGFSLSCGSALLRGLTAPYSATAVARLQAAGARVVGKTNLDEFGMGSASENSCFGPVGNPWSAAVVAGGSSGGSAAAVAAGLVPFALGSDTGGSVRQPASFCGVYGLKPTYGAVSRFGLVAYASSLDVIGVTAADLPTTQAVFETIRGVDELDQSSVDYPAAPADGGARSRRGPRWRRRPRR